MDIDTHELNKVMADVCGQTIHNPSIQGKWFMKGPGLSYKWEWSPCTDHNQMAQVKATLREMGVEYGMRWHPSPNDKTQGCSSVFVVNNFESGVDELKYFAQAVAAWWKERGE